MSAEVPGSAYVSVFERIFAVVIRRWRQVCDGNCLVMDMSRRKTCGGAGGRVLFL
jgi:hypothetical protein